MSTAILKTEIGNIGDLTLSSGKVLKNAQIAYATTGKLSPDKDNVVLVAHGFTSSHLFIGKAGPTASEGTWSGLVGPGKAVDTNRFFVVSSNMLGSSFGSTSPASVNPDTGKPYGSDFPDLTLTDIVAAQKKLLEGMGIQKLVAVVGPSYGGFQGLTWAVNYPDDVRGISMSVSGVTAPGNLSADGLRKKFSVDPNWNGGNYYDHGGLVDMMTKLRLDTMIEYRIDVMMSDKYPDPIERRKAMEQQARSWAESFDANSMIVLAHAAETYDVSALLDRIKARVQLVLSKTDDVFPASSGPATMEAFRKAGVSAEYYEIDSEYGHHAAGTDSAKWEDQLRAFMNKLI